MSLKHFESGLIPPKKAAQYLGVTAETLAVWRCTGRYPLPYVKIGRKVMYRIEDLEAFVHRGLRQNTGQDDSWLHRKYLPGGVR